MQWSSLHGKPKHDARRLSSRRASRTSSSSPSAQLLLSPSRRSLMRAPTPQFPDATWSVVSISAAITLQSRVPVGQSRRQGGLYPSFVHRRAKQRGLRAFRSGYAPPTGQTGLTGLSATRPKRGRLRRLRAPEPEVARWSWCCRLRAVWRHPPSEAREAHAANWPPRRPRAPEQRR